MTSAPADDAPTVHERLAQRGLSLPRVPTPNGSYVPCRRVGASLAASAVDQGFDRLALVRMVGYVRCSESFSEQPRVLNGASDLFHFVLGTRGEHVRVAVGTNALPRNSAVEIETIFELLR